MEAQEKETQYAEIVKLLALVLNRYRLYTEKHPAAQLAVRDFSAGLEKLLQTETAFTLGFTEGHILANDLSMDSKKPGVPEVIRECKRLQIESLTFARGGGEEELSSLFKLMAAPPRTLEGMGGFKTAFEQAGFEHIRLGVSLFKLVREEEEVVRREEIGRPEREARKEAAPEPARKVERMAEVIDHCLKGSQGEIVFDGERLSFEVERKPEVVAEQMLRQTTDLDGLKRIVAGVSGVLESRLAQPFIQEGKDFSLAVSRLAKEFRKTALSPEAPAAFRDSTEDLARMLEQAADSIKLELVVKAFQEGGGDGKALARAGTRFLRSKEIRERLVGPLRERLNRLGIGEDGFDQALADLEERRAPKQVRPVDITPEELEEFRRFKERFEKEFPAEAEKRAFRLDTEKRRVLDETLAAMNASGGLRAAVNALLDNIDSFSPPGAASTVRVINREESDFQALACRNLNGGKPNGWQSAHSLARAVMATGHPLVIEDLGSDQRAKDHEFVRKYGLVSYLGVPLVAKQDVGVLEFFTKEQHQFSAEEVGLLAAVADQAATAIHHSQAMEEVTEAKRLAAELVKSNRVKEEFLGVVSHELRTPLSSIMGYAGMMKERMLGELNPRQEEALEKVMTRSSELLGMINTILEATSIEAGGIQVECQEVHLTGLLEEIKASYEGPLEKEIAIVWDYPADPLVIKTDRVKLKHILKNLIRNAVEFTDNGQVTISARYLLEAKKVEFKVADTGNGIEAHFLTGVFDLFRQADSSGARSHGGLGLGLYIVKKYTEMLCGTVEVETDQGKGAVFTVVLPFETAAQQAGLDKKSPS
ncbi:MAG: GAF domain-containing sensor histidine kinase [Deltaproteobacteria bacterium]|nr:GAF domain-containing sensor histidine kinase [Deltaproteobacteria bacterium]